MKTTLQRRQRSADTATAEPASQNNALGVQMQTSEMASSMPLDVQLQRASQHGHSLGNFTVQPALAIGEPGDKYEQEADEIAGQAVQMKPQAGAAADSPEENSGKSGSAALSVQNQLQPTALQRQPTLDMGGDLGGGMADLGGGDMGGMTDATAGGGDMASAAGDLGGSDLGGIADAMGGGEMTDAMGGGDMGGLDGMTDAVGGDGLEGMAEAVGSSEMGKMVGDMEADGDLGDTAAGEGESVETEEVSEMLGASNVDLGFDEDGIEGKIRQAMATGGESLPDEMQAKLRSRIGMENPEDIRIHTGGQANELCDELGALAFTTGNHIFFAAGEYDPDSPEGQELIFHECVHTIQQGAIDGGGGAEDEAMEEAGVDVGMKADPTAMNPSATSVQTEETPTTNQDQQGEEQEDTSEEDSEAMASEGEKDAQNSVDAETGNAPAEGNEEVHTQEPPSDAVGTAQDLFKPVPGVEPDPVPTPEALDNAIEPTQEMEMADGIDAAQDEASGSFDSLETGGDAFPDFNAAAAQALVFAGDDAGDVLNLQMRSEASEQLTQEATAEVATTEGSEDAWEAGEEVGWPEGLKKSDTGSPGGDWIVDNMFLAGTTGKAVDIANVMAGDKSWFALEPKHWAHMFGYAAITLEIFINILELITGILDMISLALIAVMLILMMMQGICAAVSAIFSAALNPVASLIWFTYSIYWYSLWQVIAGWLVTLSNIIAWFTMIRFFMRLVAIVLWLLDALLAGAVLGWEYAKASLARAAVQGIGAASDAVSLLMFKASGGGFGDDAATAATSAGGKSFGSGAFSVASRDASETVGEAVLEEVVIGFAIGGGLGAFGEWSQGEVDEAATPAQAQVDESKVEAVRESNESLDERYEEYQASHEASKDAIPELPEDDPLASVQAATARVAACDSEDQYAQAAISETEMLIAGKQVWAEEMYGGQMILAEYHAQQEQSQMMSESYQERTAMVSSEIGDAKPMMEESQQMTGEGADQLKGQQGNIKEGGSMGNLAGQDVPASQGSVAQQGADTGAQDAAQTPAIGGDGEAAAATAMGEQGAQAEESAAIQADIENKQGQFAETQAMNQEEIEWLMEQRENLYAYWASIQDARESAASDCEEGFSEGEDWSSEVFAIISEFIESGVSDSEGEDEAETDEADIDQEDVPESDELENEEELPTLDEALENFVEAWQAMAEELGASEDEGQEELAETVVG